MAFSQTIVICCLVALLCFQVKGSHVHERRGRRLEKRQSNNGCNNDEFGCISSGYFTCHPDSYWCDNYKDCDNNEDEPEGCFDLLPPADCPALTAPTDGSLSTTAVTDSTVVTVSCNAGFVLTGRDYLVCYDGYWSNSVGTCVPVVTDCPALTAPTDGSLSTTAVTDGTLVTVSCNTGFVLTGPETLTCNDGTWSGSVGTCDPEPNGEVRRDPHLTSFDGRHFDFQGICWYTIATVCSKGNLPFFEIMGLFEPRLHSPGLEVKTRTVKVIVTYAGESVTLNKDNTVIINDSPQITETSKFEITHTIDAVTIRPRGVDLEVIWQGQEHTVNIKLDDTRYHGQTCGLLGNNDGDPSNDFVMKNGVLVDDIHKFGESWKVPGKSC